MNWNRNWVQTLQIIIVIIMKSSDAALMGTLFPGDIAFRSILFDVRTDHSLPSASVTSWDSPSVPFGKTHAAQPPSVWGTANEASGGGNGWEQRGLPDRSGSRDPWTPRSGYCRTRDHSDLAGNLAFLEVQILSRDWTELYESMFGGYLILNECRFLALSRTVTWKTHSTINIIIPHSLSLVLP